jgi:hypothetical protein
VYRKAIRLGSVALAALGVFAASACGYHLAASGDALPQGAKTIYVEKFTNRTRFTGINDQFMRYVKDEIASHDRLEVVDSPSQADLVLTGSINTSDSTPGAFNSVLEPTIYNQTMTVAAQLRDTHQNRIIWQTRGVSSIQQSPVVAQQVTTTTPSFLKQNLRGSDIAQMQDMQVAQTQNSFYKGQMMQQIAQDLYAQMAEGF